MNPQPGNAPDRTLDGDFRAIFREFAPRLYEQAHRVLGNPEEAAEAVQDIFLQVHTSMGEFRGDSTVATWVYRIAINILASHGRRKRSRPAPLPRAADVLCVVDEEADIEAEYERKESQEELARCIAKLSPREAVAITLFYMDGFGYKEIASMMQTTVGSVGILLHRGRERLHVLLTESREGMDE